MLLHTCSKPAVALTVLAYAGDWGYLICQTPDTAAALEAASEDADISVCGHVIRIQSLSTASRMYSSSMKKTTATASSVSHWRPFAAYAVFPDDYPGRAYDGLSPDDYIPDDYLQDDFSCRAKSGSFLDRGAAADAKATAPAGESSLFTNVPQHVQACDSW